LQRELEKREDGDSRELAGSSPPKKAESAPEHERKPLQGEELHLKKMTEAVGRGEEDRSRGERRPPAPRDLANEEIHPDSGEREGGENGDVVGEREVFGHGEYRPDEDGDPEKMLGVGERVETGKEDVGVEERERLPGQDVKAPAEGPGVEKGIGR
jgi:hypothetical protein